MERKKTDKDVQHCWTAQNSGNQEKGPIDGHYLDCGFQFESNNLLHYNKYNIFYTDQNDIRA